MNDHDTDEEFSRLSLDEMCLWFKEQYEPPEESLDEMARHENNVIDFQEHAHNRRGLL